MSHSLASEHAKEIARRALAGEEDPLLACRQLADLREQLPSVDDHVMSVFVGIASEVDDLPIGAERERWAAEALKSRDIEAANYRERVEVVVRDALRDLLAALGERPQLE